MREEFMICDRCGLRINAKDKEIKKFKCMSTDMWNSEETLHLCENCFKEFRKFVKTRQGVKNVRGK